MSARVHPTNDGQENRMGGEKSPWAWKKSGPKRAERLAELGPKAYHLTYEQKANAEERKKNKPAPKIRYSKVGRIPSKENVLAALAGGHLDADPDQNQCQADLQVDEAMHEVGEQEVHGSQAQQRHRIASKDDERLTRDSKNGRDRIDSENDVCYFDDHENCKQWSRHQDAVATHQESLAH